MWCEYDEQGLIELVSMQLGNFGFGGVNCLQNLFHV